MLTREMLESEMARSAVLEEAIYKELTLNIFRELQTPIKDQFDLLMDKTDQMRVVDRDVCSTIHSATDQNVSLLHRAGHQSDEARANHRVKHDRIVRGRACHT